MQSSPWKQAPHRLCTFVYGCSCFPWQCITQWAASWPGTSLFSINLHGKAGSGSISINHNLDQRHCPISHFIRRDHHRCHLSTFQWLFQIRCSRNWLVWTLAPNSLSKVSHTNCWLTKFGKHATERPLRTQHWMVLPRQLNGFGKLSKNRGASNVNDPLRKFFSIHSTPIFKNRHPWETKMQQKAPCRVAICHCWRM